MPGQLSFDLFENFQRLSLLFNYSAVQRDFFSEACQYSTGFPAHQPTSMKQEKNSLACQTCDINGGPHAGLPVDANSAFAIAAANGSTQPILCLSC